MGGLKVFIKDQEEEDRCGRVWFPYVCMLVGSLYLRVGTLASVFADRRRDDITKLTVKKLKNTYTLKIET